MPLLGLTSRLTNRRIKMQQIYRPEPVSLYGQEKAQAPSIQGTGLTEREKQVNEQMNRLSANLADLLGYIDKLTSLLAPVLREDKIKHAHPKDPEFLVPLADAIRQRAKEAEMARNRISNLISDLEI
jgi:hypothetical protein